MTTHDRPTRFLVCLLAAAGLGLGTPSLGQAAEARQPLKMRAAQFEAQFDLGSLVSLTDAAKHVLVKPPAQPRGLVIHRLQSTHRALSAMAPEAKDDQLVVRHDQFADLPGASAISEYRLPSDVGEVLSVSQRCTTPAKGVWGLSWSIGDIPLEYAIIVPGRSGVRLTATTPGARHEFDYPMGWEAPLVIVEGPGYGFSAWAEDPRGRFKRLVVERSAAGWRLELTTENFAPFDELAACESVPWRVNVYQGDWRVPARRYRDWLEKQFAPTRVAQQRPAWIQDIRCLVIMGLERELLAPLAQRLDPHQTVLYVPDWRTAGYDRDYPVYDRIVPGFDEFLAAAHALGFRVMLHVNYFGVDPLNPLYKKFEPFQVRNPRGQHEKEWWLWDRAEPVIRFAYINPALAAWRAHFVGAMRELCTRHRIDALHLDQTLCIYNDHNGLIDGQSMLDGNVALHRELRQALPDVALSGEGLNEVTCRYEAFAQRHAWGVNHADGTWDRRWLQAAHPVSSYLLRPFTVINGYLGCASPSDGQLYAAWNEAYEHWGVIPTLKTDREQLRTPTGFARQFFDEARFWLDNRLDVDLDAAWPTDVAFPFRTRDGRRAVRTQDGRFLCGTQELSRTVTGCNQVETTATISGWRAYDERRLLGLDPQLWYPCFPDARPPTEFHLSEVPAGAVVGATQATADLASIRLTCPPVVVADLGALIERATCGVRPFDGAESSCQGPLGELDGAFFNTWEQGLAAHPPWKSKRTDPATGRVTSNGTGVAFARYTLELPASRPLLLTTGVALDAGAVGPTKSDGVTFGIVVRGGGRELRVERHVADAVVQTLQLEVSEFAGRPVVVELSVHPGPQRAPSFDWARWHHPRIESQVAGNAAVTVAGSTRWKAAFCNGQPAPLEDVAGGQRLVSRSWPANVILLREPPAPAPLPVDLTRQTRTVVLMSDSGQVLDKPQFAGIHPVRVAWDGADRAALFVHPPNHGRAVAFFTLRLPDSPAEFRATVGLREGSKSDGVIFVLEANGRELVRKRMLPGKPEPLVGDLTPWAGQPLVLSLVTDSDGPFNFDWANWIAPQIAVKTP